MYRNSEEQSRNFTTFLCYLFFSLLEIVEEDLDVENMRINMQTNYPKQRYNYLNQLMRDVYILHDLLYSFVHLQQRKISECSKNCT